MADNTPPMHRRLARIGLRVGGPFGFALAGGHAIAAHGIRAEGLHVQVDLRSDTFARLHVTEPAEPNRPHRSAGRQLARPAAGTDGHRPGPAPQRAGPQVHLRSEDRVFPPDFLRRLVAERLDMVPDEIASGHCPELSRPGELADMLEGHAATTPATRIEQ